MKGSYRNHLVWFLTITGVALLLLASYNVLMDPFGAFRLVVPAGRLARSATGLATRDAKGEALAYSDWQIVMIGNSRVYMGLDPENPVFAGTKTYNAGLGGADFGNCRRAVELAIRSRTLKRVVLAVDLYEFDPDHPPVPDEVKSLIDPHINRIDYRLSTLLSAMRPNFPGPPCRMRARDAGGIDSPFGFYRRGFRMLSNGWHDWSTGGLYDYTVPKEARTNPRWKLSDPLFQSLTELLDEAGSRGVQVDVVQLPMHFIAMERFVADAQLPLYEHWLRSLAAAVDRHNRHHPDQFVKLWDFFQKNSYTTERFPTPQETSTNMQYFWDPFHFKPTLGDLVLQRMIGGAPPRRVSVSAS